MIPWVPTRQWVGSVPIPLRYWMAASQDLTAKVHTIIRTTIGQYYVNQAVTRGLPRANVQPGSVTFMQRFGSALNLNLHFHVIFLEGVYLDRTDQGLKPRFVPGEPPTDTDIAAVVQKISRRVLRKLRQLGYLEASGDAPMATGYDPLGDDAPELARTMAASVQQRIACGERAGQRVRRIGSGFGHEGERPTLTGPHCASVQGFSLHAHTQVPAHRRDELECLLRYAARINGYSSVDDFIGAITANKLELAFEELKVDEASPLVGRKLSETNIRSELDIVVVSIRRAAGQRGRRRRSRRRVLRGGRRRGGDDHQGPDRDAGAPRCRQ